MTASETALLTYWKEHREQLRQSETQRSTLTNFLLVITAALSALIVQQRYSTATIPLCVFVMLLGIYGGVTVAKYYERSAYHLSQARALTATLTEIGSLGSTENLEAKRGEHYRSFHVLHRLRLHHMWTVLHFGIFAYGVSLLVIAIAM